MSPQEHLIFSGFTTTVLWVLIMRDKGQTFMPDYFASLLVFAVVIAVFIGAWDTRVSSQDRFTRQDTFREQAVHTSSFLVSTPGYPENWENDTENVTIVGFAKEDHLLDPEKLEEFRSFSYIKQANLLQVPNFQMNIHNETHNLSLNGNDLVFGQDFSDAETVVPFERNIVLNKTGQRVEGKLRLIVWE